VNIQDLPDAAERSPARTRLNPIERAKADPKSRQKAYAAYCYDMDGFKRTPRKHLTAAAREAGGYKRLIRDTCFECVGEDADPAPRRQVRDCRCTSCPLHPVRPWQNLKGRGSAVRAPLQNADTARPAGS
jgi:hypothetical protein